MTVLEKDCRIVAAVIYWMYYGIYDDGFANDPTVAVSREKFNAQVYALAEEWKIQALKDLATKKVMVLLGDRKPSRHFLDAIEVVYRATPSHDRGLRALLSAHAGRFHRGLLQDDDGFVEKLDQVAGFGKDVVEAMSARYRRYMCCFTNCKAVFEWPADEVKNLAGCPFCLYEYNGKHRPKPAP